MRVGYVLLLASLLISSLVFGQKNVKDDDFIISQTHFSICFGSCNKVNLPNPYWKEITQLDPDVFIWGGDVVYADTKNMKKMEQVYADQNAIPAYKRMKEVIPIMGTWDDHDYGKNDAGREYSKKKESQQLFLDFIDVPENDSRRDRQGVYYSEVFKKGNYSIKVIVLDTRYFRIALKKSKEKGKRFTPNSYGNGTILGKEQWGWLQKELTDSKADYHVIMSSIQLLSGEHGFETWGNFPHEVDKFINLLIKTQAKNVIVLSGDRHISEFSKKKIPELEYPLIDFTSSGLTHSYIGYSGEKNRYRIGEVVSETSFGRLSFDLEKKQVTFEIRGINNQVKEEIKQFYK